MRALILSADNFEDTELLYPLYRLIEEGFEVDIASLRKGELTGKNGYKVTANLSLDEVDPESYQLLILPGGKAPAMLRKEPQVLEIVKHFYHKNKVIGAICHGPQVLISAGLLKDKRATAYKSVAKELKEAGANYEDAEVVIDDNIITSRMPADLPFFMRAILEKIKEYAH